MITLPSFEYLKRQPDPPHVSRVVATNEVRNRYGALITYRVCESRKGNAWWIYATREGIRMSNTLHTKVRQKGEAWIAAVNAGQVQVSDLAHERRQ